jgi:VanZ family protein
VYANRSAAASAGEHARAIAAPGRAAPAVAAAAVAAVVAVRDQMSAIWPVMVVLWAAAFVALFYLYVSPFTAPPTLKIKGVAELDFDKLYHLLSHAALLALPLAFVPDRRIAWTMGAIAIAAGVGFELCQTWVPSRSFDLEDLTANVAGLVVGALSGRIIREF